jgi:CubicO group peptidase (beta-lactamase class C family)
MKFLSLFLISAFVAGFFTTGCAQTQPSYSTPDSLAQRIQAVENNLMGFVQIDGEPPYTIADRMAFYKVKGLSIAVIRNYRIDWAKGYGWADESAKIPVTTRTLFQAASISKSLNAVGVLKLAQEHKLDLNTDINAYLTSWKFPYDSLSKGKKITIAELLSHTGGLTVHGFQGYLPGTALPNLEQILDGKPPANNPPIRSMDEPGLHSVYSGGGTVISEQIVTDITHELYARYMEEAVLKPMGMTSSSFDQPFTTIDSTLLATGYHVDGRAVSGKYHVYPEQAPAGLWTNPTDLAKYVIETQLALEGRSQKVLDEAMTRLRLTPYHDPSAALGVFIEDRNGTKYFQHGGGNDGFRSQYYGSLEGGNGVIVMVNSDNSAIMNEVVNSVAEVYDMPGLNTTQLRKVVVVDDTALLQSYTGKYDFGHGRVMTVTRVGKALSSQPVGDSRYPLYAESPAKFFVTVAPWEIEFINDGSGKIEKVILTQNSLKLEGHRVH